VEEPVFIEETMKHASIDLLFLLGFRFFEPLHDFYKLADLLVHLRGVSREHPLEVVVGGIVNLLRVLSRSHLTGKQFVGLLHDFLYLHDCFLLNL
jgi:hypothetical protein